ncbi:MAG: PASTA domain-containing protein, partial [Actinomycetota bacterium]
EPKIARQVTSLLRGVLDFGTAAGQGIGRPAAGKTGTGQNYQDAWFLGYVPQAVTGVWVGYSKEEIPMRNLPVLGGGNAYGGTIAAPIWHAVMTEAVKGLPVEDFPAPPPPKAGRVPNVVGMTQEKAEAAILKAGFTPIAQRVNSDVARGVVASQDPRGGSSVPLGSTVTIFISTGHAEQVTVPNVIGFREETATKILQDRGFGVSVHYQFVEESGYEGRVIAQNPEAGTKVKRGTTVTIVVAKQGPNSSPN